VLQIQEDAAGGQQGVDVGIDASLAVVGLVKEPG